MSQHGACKHGIEYPDTCVVCQNEATREAIRDAEALDDRLVCFLYILMRDELVPGKVADILKEHVPLGPTEPIRYTNKHLEAYAREVAVRLGVPRQQVDNSYDSSKVCR